MGSKKGETMSGGHFDYYDLSLKNEIEGEDFEDVEIQELVNDVLDLIHEYDWYKSCDTSQEYYLEHKRKFKAKWFGNPDKRLKTMFQSVVDSIDECKKKLEEAYSEVTND